MAKQTTLISIIEIFIGLMFISSGSLASANVVELTLFKEVPVYDRYGLLPYGTGSCPVLEGCNVNYDEWQSGLQVIDTWNGYGYDIYEDLQAELRQCDVHRDCWASIYTSQEPDGVGERCIVITYFLADGSRYQRDGLSCELTNP